MDTILCDITALTRYTAPPCVLALDDDDVSHLTNPRRPLLRTSDRLFGVFEKPIHVLCLDKSRSFRSPGIVCHTWTKELPSEAIQPITSSLFITSLPFTLLTTAPKLGEYALAMLLHEFCGWFSVFRLTPAQKTVLEQLPSNSPILFLGGWKPVRNSEGHLTDLWMRPPLLTVQQIRTFARQQTGTYGAKQLLRAAELVHDGAASPFEAITGMLVGTPRRRGGEALSLVGFNERIPLSPAARRIAGQSVCYGDLLLEGKAGTKPLILECQGSIVHDSRESALSDSKRLLALQSMGYTIMPVTYDQIADRPTYREIVAALERELSIEPKPKSDLLQRKELDLRRHLLSDWTRLIPASRPNRSSKR